MVEHLSFSFRTTVSISLTVVNEEGVSFIRLKTSEEGEPFNIKEEFHKDKRAFISDGVMRDRFLSTSSS
jgi:hypothetical protein